MELNNTPVRTSRNFNINNIKIDVKIPEDIKKFKNMQIPEDATVLKEDLSLKYGIGLDYIEANSKIKINLENKEEKIVCNFDKENQNLIDQILINAKGKSTITIEYKSQGEEKHFHNGVLKVIADENAEVNVNIINLLNEKSDNFQAIESILNKNSKVNYTIIDIGGKSSITNYYSNLQGENAQNDVKTVYLGVDEQLKDINYIAELYGAKTNINIDVQGALSDKAKKHFKGTIDFKKGCKKAKGDENEYCVLLSDKAKAIALPMLLCAEEDVEGNHSTASGKVDSKVLFYIMSRGLSYKEAVKLLVKSRFIKIIEQISDQNLKNEIISKIDEKLN